MDAQPNGMGNGAIVMVTGELLVVIPFPSSAVDKSLLPLRYTVFFAFGTQTAVFTYNDAVKQGLG